MLNFSYAELKRINGAEDPMLEMEALINERKEQALENIQYWEQEKSKFEKIMLPPPTENSYIQMGEDVVSAAALASEAYVVPQSKIFDIYNDANDLDKKILRPVCDNWDGNLTFLENLEKNKNLIGSEAFKLIVSKILPMGASENPRGRAAAKSGIESGVNLIIGEKHKKTENFD
jgi:hypothetical protein